MRGHIIKRAKNSYSIVISLGKDPNTGKYKYQWVSIKGTKKEAEKRLAELLHQIDTGTFIQPSKTTLAEYLERWLRDYARPNLFPRTAEGYEHIIRRHLIPALGNMTLTSLKPEHLGRYYSEKFSSGRCNGAGGLSAQTIRHHHTILHKALVTAEEWGLLSRNPADAVRPPHVERMEMHTLSEDDMARLLEAARGSSYYALFYTALFTGMRRSELLSLRWQDIDFILSQIYVNRSLHVLKGAQVVFKPPKTAAGRRTVALPPSAILLLKEYKERQELERSSLGTYLTDNDLVFCHFDGKPLLPNTVTHAWIKLVRRIGLKGIRFHDARHTHVSLMFKQGTHLKVIQERLGHSSAQITLDTYGHLIPGMQEAAAKRFDDAFGYQYTSTEK
jgi:integrase